MARLVGGRVLPAELLLRTLWGDLRRLCGCLRAMRVARASITVATAFAKIPKSAQASGGTSSSVPSSALAGVPAASVVPPAPLDIESVVTPDVHHGLQGGTRP